MRATVAVPPCVCPYGHDRGCRVTVWAPNNKPGSTTMATIETDRAGTVQGEVRMLIDGELVEAASGKRFDNINPATEEVLGEVADAGVDDMQRAIAAARRAFDETDWSTNHEFRKECLLQLQAAIESEAEELRQELVAEVGCPIALTYGPQLDAPLGDALRWPAEYIDQFEWSRDLPNGTAFGGNSKRWVTREAAASWAPSSRGTTRSRCRRRRSARGSPPATR